MRKRSFAGWSKPRIKNLVSGDIHRAPENIALPPVVTLLVEKPDSVTGPALVVPGETVKCGQKLMLFEQAAVYATAPVSGRVSRVTTRAGDFGKTYVEVDLETATDDEPDEEFAVACGTVTLETLTDFLANIPGKPGFERFNDPDRPIKKIVVNGTDPDLLAATRQYQVKNRQA